MKVHFPTFGSGVAREMTKISGDYKTGERVGSVSISSDGEYVVAGSKDKSIYFFSKDNNEPLWKYKTDYWVNTVAISSDGSYIIAGTGASQYLSEGHSTTDQESQPEKPAVCGDTICEKDETYENCPKDCTSPEGTNVRDESLEVEKERSHLVIILTICIIVAVVFVVILLLKKKKLFKKSP